MAFLGIKPTAEKNEAAPYTFFLTIFFVSIIFSHLLQFVFSHFFLFLSEFGVRLYNFTEPMAQILGGPDLFVDKGSTINLTCTIRFGSEPGGHIFWYHESKVCRHYNLSLSAIT